MTTHERAKVFEEAAHMVETRFGALETNAMKFGTMLREHAKWIKEFEDVEIEKG